MSDYFDYSTGRLVAGQTARAADVNTTFDELDTGLDKLPSEANIKRGLINYTAVDAGTPDAAIVTLTYAPTSYTDGMEVIYKSAETNTGGTCTINVNSLGAKSIVRHDGTNPVAGDIEAGKIVVLRYNSTSGKFELQGSLGAASGSGTMALQNANAVAITGGSAASLAISGSTITGGTITTTTIQDADNDTKIYIEKSADADRFQVDCGGVTDIINASSTEVSIGTSLFGFTSADPDIRKSANTGSLTITGGTASSDGGSIVMRGDNDTPGGTLSLVTGNTERIGIDSSGNLSGSVLLDEDDMTSDSATQVASQQSIKAHVAGYSPFLGDGTAGRVIRRVKIKIEDGTNASTVKLTSTSEWNGDADGPTDNCGVGTTGNWYVASAGAYMRFLSTGLSGNCIAILSAEIEYNASAVALDVRGEVNSNSIELGFRDNTSAAVQNITGLVDTGSIWVNVTYVTDA